MSDLWNTSNAPDTSHCDHLIENIVQLATCSSITEVTEFLNGLPCPLTEIANAIFQEAGDSNEYLAKGIIEKAHQKLNKTAATREKILKDVILQGFGMVLDCMIFGIYSSHKDDITIFLKALMGHSRRILNSPKEWNTPNQQKEFAVQIARYVNKIQAVKANWDDHDANVIRRHNLAYTRLLARKRPMNASTGQFNADCPWNLWMKNIPLHRVPCPPGHPPFLAVQVLLNGGINLMNRWERQLLYTTRLIDCAASRQNTYIPMTGTRVLGYHKTVNGLTRTIGRARDEIPTYPDIMPPKGITNSYADKKFILPWINRIIAEIEGRRLVTSFATWRMHYYVADGETEEWNGKRLVKKLS